VQPVATAVVPAQDSPQPDEASSGEITLAKKVDIEPLAQANATNNSYRILHFPKDSGLGTLSVLTQPNNQRYYLEPTGLPHDKWEEFSRAQGSVRVPLDKPVKLKICTKGLQYLDHLSSLPHDAFHTLDIEAFNADFSLVNVSGEKIFPYFQHLTGLKYLKMIGVDVKGKELRFIKDHTKLKRLTFRGRADFDDAGLIHLQNMTSLELLSLHVSVSDEGLRYLSPLKSLRELSLSYDNIRGPGLAHLTKLPSLEYLFIHCGAGEESSGGPTNTALRYLKGSKSLRSLYLYLPRNINDGAMSRLAELTNLEELQFSAGWSQDVLKIPDAGMPALGEMTQLRTLDISDAPVTDRGIAHLGGLTRLEKLGIGDMNKAMRGDRRITDATLETLSQLSSLKELWPCSGAFTDEGLKHLGKLRNLEALSIITEPKADTTGQGLAYLAPLSQLKWLSIEWGDVTNQGMAHIAKLKSLQYLNCGRTGMERVSVRGVNALNNLTELKELTLNSITQDNVGLDLGALTQLSDYFLYLETRLRKVQATEGCQVNFLCVPLLHNRRCRHNRCLFLSMLQIPNQA